MLKVFLQVYNPLNLIQKQYLLKSKSQNCCKPIKLVGEVCFYIFCTFFNQNYLQVLILFMKHGHNKSLSAACSLNVSILSEMPQNNQIEPSEYNVEQTGRSQFIKITTPINRHSRFTSLLEMGELGEAEEDNIKCSMLTDTRMDYFHAIEKALLVQNQNLKSHNIFLIDQVRKLYQRQRNMKKEAAAQQETIRTLKNINKELEISMEILSGDLMNEIHSLQQLLTGHSYNYISSYRTKTFQDIDSADKNSQVIAQSLETIKQIFSKADNQSQHTYESSSMQFPALNPEKYQPDLYNLDSIQYRKALQYTENMKRKIGNNIINHPILIDLQEKINNLNDNIASNTKFSKKGVYFKKIRTTAN